MQWIADYEYHVKKLETQEGNSSVASVFIKKAVKITDAISKRNYNQANGLMTGIIPTMPLETYFKNVFTIILASRSPITRPLTQTEIDALIAIAQLNPLQVGPAVHSARAILKSELNMDFIDDDVTGNTIFGNISFAPECSTKVLANISIGIIDNNKNINSNITPAITDSSGRFVFNPYQLRLLDSTLQYGFYVVSPKQYFITTSEFKKANEWIAQGQINLTLGIHTIRGVLVGNQFCSLESTAGVPVIIADSSFKRVANISSAITTADGTFSFDAAQVALLDSTQKYSLALDKEASAEPVPVEPKPIDSLISACVVKEIVMELEPVIKDSIIIRPAPDTIRSDKQMTDSAGNTFIVDTASTDFTLRKYDSSSNLLWTSTYTGSTNVASAVCHDMNGNIYVTGKSWNGSDFDYLTVKIDSSGNTVWALRYDANWTDMATAICVDANGNVYVAGLTWNGSSYDYTTIRYLQCEPYNSARIQNPPTEPKTSNLKPETAISIYPNPNNGELVIKREFGNKINRKDLIKR